MRLLALATITGLFFSLNACSSSGGNSGKASLNTQRVAEMRLIERVQQAGDTFRSIVTASDGSVPEGLLKRSNCMAVIPGVLKAAFIVGGRHGEGIATCRTPENTWSPPAFVSLTGASVGFQIGAESADLVLFFAGEKARAGLYRNNLTLGGDIGITAGPVGRQASGQADSDFQGVYSYAKAAGLFAGISLAGTSIRPNPEANELYYGQAASNEDILSERVGVFVPSEARSFLAALP